MPARDMTLVTAVATSLLAAAWLGCVRASANPSLSPGTPGEGWDGGLHREVAFCGLHIVFLSELRMLLNHADSRPGRGGARRRHRFIVVHAAARCVVDRSRHYAAEQLHGAADREIRIGRVKLAHANVGSRPGGGRA